MKKIYTTILAAMLPLLMFAQGWPANYGGVMLQGFYWDSYDDTKWTNLTAQADELSKYFDLIWVPNSGYCKQAQSMGYNPVYYYNHNSAFGKPKELLNMIKTFKEKGTGFIMDVVINHRNGATDWTDFPTEKNSLDGQTYSMTGADICKNDDGGYTAAQGYEVGVNDDTGDDFSGARDLDHKSKNVQDNCKAYCKFLLEKIGYVGFRLDMVKGYSPEYTKMYNEYSKPQFCVGENWDGYETITNWINGTGKTSAAFDFPLKFQLNKAFGDGNYSALSDKGVVGDSNYSRYAVTFVDNHDTGRESTACPRNQLGATAFILGMPGTPCVFLKHWKKWPRQIGNMILARKAAGLTNQSTIEFQDVVGSGYVIKVKGTKGTVMVTCGDVGSYDTSGFTKIESGSAFGYYVSSNVTVEGLDYTAPEKKDYTVYVAAHAAPTLYAWDNEGTELNGEWPGTQLSETTTTPNGTEWYVAKFNTASLNVILNNGNGGQTANIEDIDEETYLYYNGRTGYEIVDKEFVKPLPVTGITVHVNATSAPYLYAWNDGGALNGEWPGARMTDSHIAANGTLWYDLTLDADKANIIFSNGQEGEANQTADITGLTVADVYFTWNGTSGYEQVTSDYQGQVVGDQVIIHVCSDTAPYLYTWDGGGAQYTGAWPGTQMTTVTTTPNGTEWYTATINASVLSFILGDGTAEGGVVGVNQTADIADVTGEVYYTWNGGGKATQVTAEYMKGEAGDNEITIYIKADAAPHLYVWDEYGTPLNGDWPGNEMTETKSVEGTTYYAQTFKAESINAILNDGTFDGIVGETQTADITGITADIYLNYDGHGAYSLVGESTDAITIFVNADVAPYLYSWDGIYRELNGVWPGTKLAETATTADGKTWWKHTFEADVTSVNIIFNNGNGGQTANIEGITSTSYFTYDGNTGYENVSSQYVDVPEPTLPDCAEYLEGKLFVYFEAPSDYPTPYVWAWNEGGNLTGDAWPGTGVMEKVGNADNGNAVYRYIFEQEPTGLVFSNAGNPQTSDFAFTNGGYYTVNGLYATVKPATGIRVQSVVAEPQPSAAIYDMQGRRLNGTPQRGLYIVNGKKIVIK